MVEWIGLGIVVGGLIVFCGLFFLTYNIAKGGVDIMEFFSNTGRRGAGFTKNNISGFGSDDRQKEKVKWGMNGKKQ